MGINSDDLSNLNEKARRLRVDSLNLAVEEEGGHLGGAFSSAEIFVALFDNILKTEDRFILSKGHSCNPYYQKLRERGYNPQTLLHPERDVSNGIYCATGSLGHGLPVAAGMAWARKLLGIKGDVYVLVGDGEIQEGTTWETSLFAANHGLDNLIAVLDKNGIQGSGFVKDILPLPTNLERILSDLGWSTSTIDGHNFEEIIPSLEKRYGGRPRFVIANTVKGKGVSFMENNPSWHGGVPKADDLILAYEELKRR
ncbi:MAG: transketolase [Nanoarchaeota archaeon]|nr:transketolase [Nanoarchaeota archaeon]